MQHEQVISTLKNGNIHLIFGPMFSGKTTELLRLYNRSKIAGQNCILIKYDKDTRYDVSNIITHNGMKTDANIDKIFNLHNLSDMTTNPIYINEWNNATHIFIDEIQFYPNAAQICDEWANKGKHIILSGLNGDFKREPFEQISLLIPKCEKITHLNAICAKTGNDASYSKRITTDETVEVIGGGDVYMPVDRQTYFENS